MDVEKGARERATQEFKLRHGERPARGVFRRDWDERCQAFVQGYLLACKDTSPLLTKLDATISGGTCAWSAQAKHDALKRTHGHLGELSQLLGVELFLAPKPAPKCPHCVNGMVGPFTNGMGNSKCPHCAQ